MSIKVTNWAWAHSQSRNGARLVLLAIADRADEDGFAWPSIEDIAERTLLSPRAVQKGILALTDLGELKVESGGGRHRRNRYTIIPKPRTSDGVTRQEPRQDDGVTAGKPRTSDGVSERETPNSATETPHFEPETPNSATENPVNSSPEPPVEPPEEPSGNLQLTLPGENLPAIRTEAAVDTQPGWLAALMDAMSDAGINLPWKFVGDDQIRIANDISRLGIPLMVKDAVDVTRSSNQPVFSSRFFYDRWHRIRTPPPGSADANVVQINTSRQQREVDDWANRAMNRAQNRMNQESS